jgi:dihydrofolate reductase
VRLRVDGDARFPAIDPKLWREVDRSEHEAGTEDAASFAFVNYERAAGVPSIA